MKFISREEREFMRARAQQEQSMRMQAEASRQRGIMEFRQRAEIESLSDNMNSRLDRIEKSVKPPKTYKRNKDAFWEQQNRYSQYDNDSACDEDW